jgi:hypothetical protein
MIIEEPLLEWATPRQAEYIRAVHAAGSIRKAAKTLGLHHSAITKSLHRLQKLAALHGYSPACDMTRKVPDPFIVKGVSSYYNKDGELAGQWVKSKLDNDKLNAMLVAAAAAMSEDIPKAEPVKAPKSTIAALLNLYVITDAHVGMLAWDKESGEDWDLKIAEYTLVKCFERMIETAPAAESCVISELGDFLHFDSLKPVTPEHGNLLDADSRFSKMVGVAIRVLRSMVRAALGRHKTVHLIISQGNHDEASSVWLRHMFAALYENEPRVIINNSEAPYYVHQHGATMLAFHHGHLLKNENLPLMIAAQYSAIWGATTKRYIHTGHRHTKVELEYPGVLLVQHPTLAARDAYASSHGWISERDATAMTYHVKYGLVARTTVTPGMIDE